MRLMCSPGQSACWDSEIKRAQEMGHAGPSGVFPASINCSSYLCLRCIPLKQKAHVCSFLPPTTRGTIAAIVPMARSRFDACLNSSACTAGEPASTGSCSLARHRRHADAARVYAPVGSHEDLRLPIW